MEKKLIIKEEDPVTGDIASQYDSEFIQKFYTVKTGFDAVLLDSDCDMTVKTEIKSETPIIKIKTEFVTCSNNWEIHGTNEVEENKGKFLPEDPVVMGKIYSSDHGIHNNIEIEEESRWLETETSSACDNSKETLAETNQEKEDLLSSQLSSLTSHAVSEESGISNSLIRSEPRGHCQMEKNPSHLKTAKFAANSLYEYHRSEKSFKLNQPRPYKCDICEKSFKQRSHLNKHFLLHSDTKPYKCNKCEKSFKQKSNLNIHVQLHSNTRPYKCKKCEKSFKLKSDLNKHIPIHSDTRTYKCNNCEKSFKQKNNLNKHIRLHLDIRPYKCHICEKSFKQKFDLNKHILFHSESRPYKCNKCEKSFKQNCDLNRHIQLHSDTRPYKCDKCDKSFKHKYHLVRHIRLHSDISPYKCNKCEKSFKQTCDLNRHIWFHSDTRPYKCNKCENTFKQKSHLKRHILLHSDTTS